MSQEQPNIDEQPTQEGKENLEQARILESFQKEGAREYYGIKAVEINYDEATIRNFAKAESDFIRDQLASKDKINLDFEWREPGAVKKNCR